MKKYIYIYISFIINGRFELKVIKPLDMLMLWKKMVNWKKKIQIGISLAFFSIL